MNRTYLIQRLNPANIKLEDVGKMVFVCNNGNLSWICTHPDGATRFNLREALEFQRIHPYEETLIINETQLSAYTLLWDVMET